MPILFSYPEKSNPVGADLLFITDSASNNTNTIKISSIQDVIDVVDTFNADAPLVAAGTGAGPYTGAITLSLGTVPVNKGGTNLTSYTQGDLLYAPIGAALQGLSIGTAGQVLKVNSGGTAPFWGDDIGVKGSGTQYNVPLFNNAAGDTIGDSLLSQPSAVNMVFGASTLSGKFIDFQNHKIAFDSDNTNTFIKADTSTPESLEIHADHDVVLNADNYVVINPGIAVPAGGLDLGAKGSITFDTNFLYIAVDDDDWRKVALSAI